MKDAVITYDAIVVGAGPAGLTAAYLLAQEGRTCLLLEKDPNYVGGLARSVQYRGFRFDIGTHRFYTQSDAVKRLWSSWLPAGMLQCVRQTRIYYRRKYFRYPLEPFEALRHLGILESVRCIFSYLKGRLIPIPTERSFEDWVVNRFGRRLFEVFFKTYTEKVWGLPTQLISKDWAAQRIRSLSVKSILQSYWKTKSKRALQLFAKRESIQAEPRTLIRNFEYPELGPGMMWEACAEKFVKLGGVLARGVKTQGMTRESGNWRVEYSDGEGRSFRAQSSTVISSMPLPLLLNQLMPSPSPDVLAAAARLRFRDFIVVNVITEGKMLFPDHWLYIHDPLVKVGRISNYRAFSEKMVPDLRFHSYGMEYFCSTGDAIWELSDLELGNLAKNELQHLGFCGREAVREFMVVRQTKAYPIYDECYQKNVELCRTSLENEYEGMHTIGRNGMHHYNNQDHAMLTAMVTVKNILAGDARSNAWSVNSEEEYIEEPGTAQSPNNSIVGGVSHACPES